MAVINNLLNNVVSSRVANAAAASATTAVTSTAVDVRGYIGVRFTAALGDVLVGSVLGLTAEHSANGTTGWVALEGALSYTATAADADNKLLILDVVRPEEGFVRAVLTRATAAAVVDGIFADTYGPKDTPVAQGATVLASATLANPTAA